MWFIVSLKHRPFGGTVNTFCDVKEQSSDRDVLVSAAEVVVPIHITRAGAGQGVLSLKSGSFLS